MAFKLADMVTELHTARLTVMFAANALDSGNPAAATYCAMVRAPEGQRRHERGARGRGVASHLGVGGGAAQGG